MERAWTLHDVLVPSIAFFKAEMDDPGVANKDVKLTSHSELYALPPHLIYNLMHEICLENWR